VKSLLWVCLFLAGVTGVVFPLLYLYNASDLPQLESIYQVEGHLKGYVEGQRRAERAGITDQGLGPIDWKRPEFNALPRDLVAVYISQWGCPGYFQTPRDTPFKMAWRALDFAFFGAMPSGQEGRCEFRFALRLAQAMHIKGGRAKLAIAAFKIRGVMQKPELVAYDLATTWYAPGVIGIEDASRALFHQELSKLPLPAIAELGLAMPPNGFYAQEHTCENPLLLKQARDAVLADLSHQQLVAPEQIRLAQGQPMACLH
jgi:hypothetical protein